MPVKRVPLIAKALKILDGEGLKLEWTHYGSGPDFHEVQKEMASCQGIKWALKGSVSNSEIIDAYSAGSYDLFVNASSSEGLPLSIMEACAAGLPVVATDVGGTHEIIIEGVNGVLIPEDINANIVAGAIRYFANLSEGEMSSFRRGARDVWARSFRAADNASVMLDAVGQ